MTINQALKKCDIARRNGKAYIDNETNLYFDDVTKEFSLYVFDGHYDQCVCVKYSAKYIAEIIAD